MWAKGLNTNSSELVSLTGSTYFADDLTISGRNNNVTLAGNYYGYGSTESAQSDDCKFKDSYVGASPAELNSAITINWKEYDS